MRKYQNFSQRVGAAFIDGLLFVPVLIADYYLLSPSLSVTILCMWIAFTYSIFLTYSVLSHAYFGQTIGKRLMGIQVRDVSEERLPTLRQAVLRDIGYIVPTLVLIVYLEYLVVTGGYSEYLQAAWDGTEPQAIRFLDVAGMLWFAVEVVSMATNSKQRALHDFIAGTVVIRIAEESVFDAAISNSTVT